MPWIPEAGEGIFYGGNLELSALRYSKFTSSPKKVILARLLPTSNAVHYPFVQDYQLGRIYGENGVVPKRVSDWGWAKGR